MRGENSMLRQNSNTARPNLGARFALGQTFITPGAQEALEISGETPIQFLRRHVSTDWGELSEEDVRENELSLREGFRLLSAYQTAKGQNGVYARHSVINDKNYTPAAKICSAKVIVAWMKEPYVGF
jgi:hypothetical protein